MGKIYIKEENGQKVLYEENNSIYGLFGDKKLGELQKNLDGSLETRNFFGENYKLTEDRDELGEILTCIIPGTLPNDYNVETSDGESGTLKYNNWKERHETEDKLENKVIGNYSNSGSSHGGSSYGRGRTKLKGSGGSVLAAFAKLYLVCVLLNGLYWVPKDYKEHPERYKSLFNTNPVQHRGGIINTYKGYGRGNIQEINYDNVENLVEEEFINPDTGEYFKTYSEYLEHLARQKINPESKEYFETDSEYGIGKRQEINYDNVENLVEETGGDIQSFNESTVKPMVHQEIALSNDKFTDLERLVVQKEILEILESAFVAGNISESLKNQQVNMVESESTSTASLYNFKRRISQPVNIQLHFP